MAGVPGNVGHLAWAKQVSKGTPNTTFVKKAPFSGGGIAPVKNVDQLAETDSSRDIGVSYVSSTGVEGSPEVYVRDDGIASLLEAVLGTTISSGATNFLHTITAANALPYLTLYRDVGGVLLEQFEDCMVSELTISADAGSPLTAAATIVGRKAVRQATEPVSVGSLTMQSGSVYNFNDATVTLAGGATSLVSGFEISIANGVSPQQTDDVAPYDVNPGAREVTGGFTMLFETLAEYNRFNYGTTSGTAQDATLANVALDFNFSKGANNGVQFQLPGVAYEEFPVDVDPGGDAIEVDARFRAQRPSSGSIITALVKNQKATPWTP